MDVSGSQDRKSDKFSIIDIDCAINEASDAKQI